jgi:hypothetical protein
MKHGLGLGLTLVICGAVDAADAPSRVVPERNPSTPARLTPAPAAQPAAVQSAAAEPAKRLDLRIGDVRKYMMPRDFQAALKAPDADANTVVVEGQRYLAPMRQVEDVPMGLASLWYAAKDPKNAWRLLAPAVGVQDGPTVDKVPPPVFRWGP